METATWLSPLIALPGVAMLVLSTSARYAEVHTEIHRLAESGNRGLSETLLARARRFRNVLVVLYLCVALLGLAGLLGCTMGTAAEGGVARAIGALTAVALLLLIVAAAELVREASSSLKLMEHHVEKIGESGAQAGHESASGDRG